MKTKIVIVTLAVAAAMLVFVRTTSERDVTNAPARGTTIVAFGDSLVEGVGATSGSDFVSVLSRKAGLPIANMGKAGDTTADGLARVSALRAKKPDVVLLLLGGNDFLRKIPKAETFGNLAKIIDLLHADGAVVVLLGVRGGILADEFEEEFERLAEEKGTAYVPDVLDDMLGDRNLMSDAIHPNDAGYARIAERAYIELARVLP